MAGGYSAATLNDIRTATGMTEGDLLYSQVTKRFYEYKPASTETEAVPWVIDSNSPGCWIAIGDNTKVRSITDANTIAIDCSLGTSCIIAMTQTRATRQLINPTNLVDGLPFNIYFKNPASQLSGGGWPTFTLSSKWTLIGGPIAPPIGANKVALLTGHYVASEDKIYCTVGAEL